MSQLYERACEENGLHDGVSSPDGFFITMSDKWIDPSFFQYNTYSSSISTICNAFSIYTSLPLPCYTLFFSNDDFKNLFDLPVDIHNSYDMWEMLDTEVDYYTEAISNLLKSCGKRLEVESKIDDVTVQNVVTCLANLRKYGESPRIQNAYRYFFYAWHAGQIEHTCINLSVVLEALFSPAGNGELSHQISYFTSHFLGGKPEERKSIYLTIKKFYNLRSKIVHGGQVKMEELHVVAPSVFILCSEILQKLFLDEEYLNAFSKDKAREDLFNNWLFQ